MPSSPLYPYTLLRSKRKTLALQITREGEIVVRSPLKLPEEEIRRFVAEKSPWIQKHLEQISVRHTQAPAAPLPGRAGSAGKPGFAGRFPGG